MALCEAASGGCALLWPRVLLFGDSITQFSFQQGGWGASLADRLVRKCDVLNRGFSGYNTRWAKIILPRLIRKGNSLDSPVAVTIFFGANDSALKDENPKQHIPLAEYVANLESMVGYLQEAGVPRSRVVLITPPPLCEAAWERECLLQGAKPGPGQVLRTQKRLEPGACLLDVGLGRAAGPSIDICCNVINGLTDVLKQSV